MTKEELLAIIEDLQSRLTSLESQEKNKDSEKEKEKETEDLDYIKKILGGE